MSLRSILTTFLSFCVLLAALGSAREQHPFKPTTAAPAVSAPLTGAHGYTYIGCWNETVGFRSNGGARALAGGKDATNDTLTTSACLQFCSRGKNGHVMQYAGLGNGRECWCSPSLSILSEKLNESSRCVYSCTGNDSEICGGPDALTLYNLTSPDSKTGIARSQFSEAAGYGTLAIATLIIAALM